MLLAQRALARLQRPADKAAPPRRSRLCRKQDGQVVHAAQRVGMLLAQRALAHFQRLAEHRLRFGVLPQVPGKLRRGYSAATASIRGWFLSSVSTRAAARSSICRSRVVSLPLASSGFTLLSISSRKVGHRPRLLLRPGRPHRLPGAHDHPGHQQSNQRGGGRHANPVPPDEFPHPIDGARRGRGAPARCSDAARCPAPGRWPSRSAAPGPSPGTSSRSSPGRPRTRWISFGGSA